MSTKALKTQLLAAIAMVLVASIALGSSTYAWFASNSKVTANNMQVSATTSKNLLISNQNAGTFAETATAIYTGSVSLRPSSVQTLAGTQNFFKNNDGKNVDYAVGKLKKGAETVAATVTPAADDLTDTKDVIKYDFYVKVNGTTTDAFDKLYVSSITVTGNNIDINKALRVGVVSGDKGYIYAPITGASTAYKGVIKAGTMSSDADATLFGTDNVTLTTAGTDTATLGNVDSNTKTVSVYVWYEGQDASCVSANAISTENLTISVEFAAE